MYLTYEEYKEQGFSKVDREAFNELELYAERHINLVTRDYYMLHSLAEDTWQYRVTKFKLAMAIQVDYLNSLNGKVTLSDLLNDSPKSVSVGRMRIETNNASKATTVGKTMFCTEAYTELTYTGLLYKGADYV